MLEGFLGLRAMLYGIAFLEGRVRDRPSSVLRYIDRVWQLQQEDRLPDPPPVWGGFASTPSAPSSRSASTPSR